MSSLPAKDKADVAPALPLKFEFATTGRSSCKGSGLKIGAGDPRIGVPQPQYKGSYSWFSPNHAIQEVKQPKTKNGLKCKVCAAKITADLIVVGKGATTVCAPCYAATLASQQPIDSDKFLFQGDFGKVEGFTELPDDRKIIVGQSVAGAGFTIEGSAKLEPQKKAKSLEKPEADVDSSSSPSPAKKQKKIKAPVQSITSQTPLVPKPLDPTKTYFKAVSLNVAGLRAFYKKDPSSLANLLTRTGADMMCIQEHKLQGVHVAGAGVKSPKKGGGKKQQTLFGAKKVKEVPDGDEILEVGFKRFLEAAGYEDYWTLSETKKGYSGVAVFIKKESPWFVGSDAVTIGEVNEVADDEGRVITVDFDGFSILSCYVPNSGQNLERLGYRTETWDKDLLAFMQEREKTRGCGVVWCGDLNVAHMNKDAYNFGAKHLEKQAGLTEQERSSFSDQLSAGFVDSFRHLYPDHEGHYSYWSGRAGNRPENKGLRLDYFICSEGMVEEGGKAGVRLHDSYMLDDVTGSDHGPCVLVLEKTN